MHTLYGFDKVKLLDNVTAEQGMLFNARYYENVLETIKYVQANLLDNLAYPERLADTKYKATITIFLALSMMDIELMQTQDKYYTESMREILKYKLAQIFAECPSIIYEIESDLYTIPN